MTYLCKCAALICGEHRWHGAEWTTSAGQKRSMTKISLSDASTAQRHIVDTTSCARVRFVALDGGRGTGGKRPTAAIHLTVTNPPPPPPASVSFATSPPVGTHGLGQPGCALKHQRGGGPAERPLATERGPGGGRREGRGRQGVVGGGVAPSAARGGRGPASAGVEGQGGKEVHAHGQSGKAAQRRQGLRAGGL